MAAVELIMPKMGESIMEATILSWLKNEGDKVEVDEAILEIATDKVDSEVPSEVEGVISKVLFKEGDVIPVGTAIAIIETDAAGGGSASPAPKVESKPEPIQAVQETVQEAVAVATPPKVEGQKISSNGNGRFYSPLVMNIARSENISMQELESIPGSGQNGRVTKKDVLSFLDNKGSVSAPSQPAVAPSPVAEKKVETTSPAVSVSGNVEIQEMGRMRKLIANHMINSIQTSAHVTSFVEADVTNLVTWRNKAKKVFQQREGEKLTFTPLFIEAIVKAIKDFPNINASVDGDRILIKKDINIGMAAALPNGNLIVPVIKNADQLNLLGLSKRVNDLAGRARTNSLKPDEIDGGTYTVSNVGTFGNVMGTPIINQPQVGILALGAIQKKPVVIETEEGDTIGIRHMMFLSHSYDHRVVDGMLGGSFVRRVADYLEQFDANREI